MMRSSHQVIRIGLLEIATLLTKRPGGVVAFDFPRCFFIHGGDLTLDGGSLQAANVAPILFHRIVIDFDGARALGIEPILPILTWT